MVGLQKGRCRCERTYYSQMAVAADDMGDGLPGQSNLKKRPCDGPVVGLVRMFCATTSSQ